MNTMIGCLPAAGRPARRNIVQAGLDERIATGVSHGQGGGGHSVKKPDKLYCHLLSLNGH